MSNDGGLISNLAWKFSERIASQVVSFIVSIILARILLPSDYGAVAMVTVFIALAQVFVEGGFSGALIQKKDADRLDFSSVFYFILAFSVVMYLVIFFTAPYISNFYGEGYEVLTPVLRVLGIQIVIFGVNSVQQAYVSREMMFRKFFYSTLVGTIVSAILGLSMAYMGYGVWAIVGQQLSMTLVNTITLFLITRKLPSLEFSWARLKGLLNYGIKLFVSNVLITFHQELRALIVGKLYSPSDLAYYDKGRSFPNIIVANINSSIGAVLFPKISREQDDINQVRRTTRYSIRFSAFLMSPLMLGLAAVAEPFIRLLLTDKWVPCVPLLQVFCVVYLFQPIHTANMQAIKAIGRSDVFLWLEIIKKVIELVVLFLVMRMGVMAIVLSMAVLTTLYTFVNAYPNSRLIHYSFSDQMKDIMPSIGNSLIMGSIVYMFSYLPLQDWTLLLVQIPTGVMVYILLSKLFKIKEYQMTKDIAMGLLRKFKGGNV
jgi:O-antigen/teichoic acid export membrane protein